MKIVADENVPGDVVVALRTGGHNVLWARTDFPGSGDDEVLSRAQAEARVVLMFDKDFGELALHKGLPTPAV